MLTKFSTPKERAQFSSLVIPAAGQLFSEAAAPTPHCWLITEFIAFYGQFPFTSRAAVQRRAVFQQRAAHFSEHTQ